MTIYQTKLINKETIAQATMAFYLEKPVGFQYKAGQHIDLKLLNTPLLDPQGNSRILSLVSAPFEKDLVVATRMRSSVFKRLLEELPLGAEFQIEGPFGSMTLPNDFSRPLVFIAGGIGITPFVSMIRYAFYKKLAHKIYLFYSNRKPEEAAFLTELQEIERNYANFKLIATMTAMAESSREWQGRSGRIGAAMLKEFISDWKAPRYYLAGSPLMVQDLREILVKVGVSENSIRSEEFAGY